MNRQMDKDPIPQAHQALEIEENELALLSAFREIRSSGRTAAAWRTLGKFANAKALEEEREYEARFMNSIPGQVHLRLRLHDKGIIDRLHSILEAREPVPPGVRHRRRTVPSADGADLCYELMLKGLEAMEQEMASADNE